MTDEILSAQRPPEKEEAAPAPASALGTATTSNDVTNDITMSYGDGQAITETHIAERPADAGVAAPAGDDWRRERDLRRRAEDRKFFGERPGIRTVLDTACNGFMAADGAHEIEDRFWSVAAYRAANVGYFCYELATGLISSLWDIIPGGPNLRSKNNCSEKPCKEPAFTLSDLAQHILDVMIRRINVRNKLLLRKGLVYDKGEAKALSWSLPKELTPFEAALLAMAYHHRPEHGVVWSVYADVRKPGGGNLKWRDPKTGAWGDFVINLGEGEFGGPMYEDFIALLPGGDARAFREFRAHFTRFIEMYRKYDMTMARVEHDLASQWSLTNGGAKRLNRYTKEFVDVTDDPVELTANGAAVGIYLEDDGTGHAKFPKNFVRETPDNNDIMRTFDANRDFFAAFAKPGEEEVVKDAMLTVCGYWYGYDAGSREAVALIGVIGGAKSTLIKVLERSGSGNLATVPWSELKDRSKLFSLNGKAAMLSGEIGENIRSTTRVNFNMITAHDTISVHQLFVGDTQIDFCGPIIGASNMMPKTDDRTGAFESRVAVFDADHSVYDNDFYLPEVGEKFVFKNEFQAWLLGLVCAVFNAFVGAYVKLPTVMSSVILMQLFSGLTTYLYGDSGYSARAIVVSLDILNETWVRVIVLVALIAIAYYLTNYTVVGKRAKAIGSNKLAAQQAGADLLKTRVLCYGIFALFLCVASVFAIARKDSFGEADSVSYQMDIMIMLLMGGMPLSGGYKGRVLNTVVGTLTYVVLNLGLSLCGVSAEYVFFVRALIFVIIVCLTCRKPGLLLPR